MDYKRLAEESYTLLREFMETARLDAGDLVAIGCSTSEIQGDKIGTSTSSDIASLLYEVFQRVESESNIVFAYQCCEHLNRALVIHVEEAKSRNLEIVHVVPKPHAGGAMAAVAYRSMTEAVVVENLKASAFAGIDIGETMIGMHIRPVVVPLRLTQKTIGAARVNAGYSRAKLIGGSRAEYV